MARAEVATDQKKAIEEGRTIVYVDEAGFYLLPSVVRTYAPRGQTPMLVAPKTYQHLSVSSGITATGQLVTHMQTKAYRGATIVGFLRHLLNQISGKILVLWDGARMHRSKAVQQFLSTRSDPRLHLERLPAYAPDLNPDEGVWHYLKNVELRNVVCETLQELRYEVRLAIARLRHKRSVIQACIAHARL
jgi:transposase